MKAADHVVLEDIIDRANLSVDPTADQWSDAAKSLPIDTQLEHETVF